MATEVYSPSEEELASSIPSDEETRSQISDYIDFYRSEFDAFAADQHLDSSSFETKMRFYLSEQINPDHTSRHSYFEPKATRVVEWRRAGRPPIEEWQAAHPVSAPSPDATPGTPDTASEEDDEDEEVFIPSDGAIKDFLKDSNKELQEQMVQYATFYKDKYSQFLADNKLKDSPESAYRFFLAENVTHTERYRRGAKERWEAAFKKDYFDPSKAAVTAFEADEEAKKFVSKYATFYKDEYKKFCADHKLEPSPAAEYRFYLADTRTATGEMKEDANKKLLSAMNSGIFVPTEEAVNKFVSEGKAEDKQNVAKYATFYQEDYAKFCEAQSLEPSPAAEYRFYLAQTYEPDGTLKADAQEKWNNALKDSAQVTTTEFVDSASLTSSKKGTTLERVDSIEALHGKIENVIAQEVPIKNGAALGLIKNQTLYYFEETKLGEAETTSQLLSVSQGEKPVAGFYQDADGKIYLTLSKEAFKDFFAGHEELQGLVGTEDSIFYTLPVEKLQLSQDMNIEDIQIKGTDGSTFAVTFSALGCQFKTPDGKTFIQRTEMLPYSIGVSRTFVDRAHDRSSDSISIGGKPASAVQHVEDHLAILALRHAEEYNPLTPTPDNPYTAEVNVGDAKLYSIKANNHTLRFMERDGELFVYLNLNDKRPQFYSVHHMAAVKGDDGKLHLSIGLGKEGKEVARIDMGDEKDADSLRTLYFLQKNHTATARRFDSATAIGEPSHSRLQTLPIPDDTDGTPRGVTVTQSNQEVVGYHIVNDNVATLQRTLSQTERTTDGEIPPQPDRPDFVTAEHLATPEQEPLPEQPKIPEQLAQKIDVEPKKKKAPWWRRMANQPWFVPLAVLLTFLLPPVGAAMWITWNVDKVYDDFTKTYGKPRVSKAFSDKLDHDRSKSRAQERFNNRIHQSLHTLAREIESDKKYHNRLVQEHRDLLCKNEALTEQLKANRRQAEELQAQIAAMDPPISVLKEARETGKTEMETAEAAYKADKKDPAKKRAYETAKSKYEEAKAKYDEALAVKVDLDRTNEQIQRDQASFDANEDRMRRIREDEIPRITNQLTGHQTEYDALNRMHIETTSPRALKTNVEAYRRAETPEAKAEARAALIAQIRTKYDGVSEENAAAYADMIAIFGDSDELLEEQNAERAARDREARERAGAELTDFDLDAAGSEARDREERERAARSGAPAGETERTEETPTAGDGGRSTGDDGMTR